MRALFLTIGLAPLLAPPAAGGAPELGRVEPPGVTRGDTVTLAFHGERLHDATEILCRSAALSFGPIEVLTAKLARATVTVDPACPLGQHRLRIVTRSGVTALRSLWIGAYPTQDEVEPNDVPAAAAPIDLGEGPRTIHGLIEGEDVDHYAIDLAEGARLAVEIEAMRLGRTMFDPRLELLDDEGGELVRCDDTPLLGQDAWFVFRAPRAMRVVLLVRDAAWRGGGLHGYRLHVGDFPRPVAVWPPGGRPNQEVTVRFLGPTPDEDHERTITLPPYAPYPFGLFLEEAGVSSPSGAPFRLSGHRNALETEPNDTLADATDAPAVSCALNGVIERPGDVDWFRVPVRKGQELRLRAMGRFLGSPVDLVLMLADDEGKVVGENDDTGGPDSRLDFKATGDGHCRVGVRDHRGRGGREFVYRVEIVERRPSLSLSIPRFGRDSQARQSLPVPRGGRVATSVRASRSQFDGTLTFEARGLPPGVTMVAPPLPESETEVVVVFEAAADAPLGGTYVDLRARREKTADSPAITGRYRNSAELVTFGPNRAVYYRTVIDRLALAVVEEPPFSLEVDEPATELVQGGLVDLRIRVTRDEDFDGPITVRRLWLPRGTSAPTTITVKPGETEATLRVDARGDARLGTYPIALLGETDRGGATFQASGHVTLHVTEPYVTGKCAIAAIERGADGEVVCTLEGRRTFEGTATARLKNLPAGVTAVEREISADAREVVFPITAAAKGRLGLSRNLFVELRIPSAGGLVLARTAGGGQLRVDPPSPAAKATATDGDADGPRLGRLEQLRRDAKRRAEERRSAVAGDGASPETSGGSR